MDGKKKRALEVIEFASGDVVKTLDMTGKSDRYVEKVEMGLLRQMDLERFGVRDTALSRVEG